MENNYQLSRIHNYVNGLMSKDDMHALEREALEDPFLQDAIDGYTLQKGVDLKPLSLLQKRLTSRVETQHIAKNKRFYSWQRLAIGMTAAVMFIALSVPLLMKYLPQHKTGLSEVEIMSDQTYETIILPSDLSDAAPDIGWNKLGDLISARFTSIPKEGVVAIYLKVDESGKAHDIEVRSKDNNFFEDKELIKLLENKVKWSGEYAQFSVEFRKINL